MCFKNKNTILLTHTPNAYINFAKTFQIHPNEEIAIILIQFKIKKAEINGYIENRVWMTKMTRLLDEVTNKLTKS